MTDVLENALTDRAERLARLVADHDSFTVVRVRHTTTQNGHLRIRYRILASALNGTGIVDVTRAALKCSGLLVADVTKTRDGRELVASGYSLKAPYAFAGHVRECLGVREVAVLDWAD